MAKYIVEMNPRFVRAVSEEYYHEWASMYILFQNAKSKWRDEKPYYAWNNSWWAMVEAESSVDAIRKLLDFMKEDSNGTEN